MASSQPFCVIALNSSRASVSRPSVFSHSSLVISLTSWCMCALALSSNRRSSGMSLKAHVVVHYRLLVIWPSQELHEAGSGAVQVSQGLAVLAADTIETILERGQVVRFMQRPLRAQHSGHLVRQ